MTKRKKKGFKYIDDKKLQCFTYSLTSNVIDFLQEIILIITIAKTMFIN
jgi:hypothetical protein